MFDPGRLQGVREHVFLNEPDAGAPVVVKPVASHLEEQEDRQDEDPDQEQEGGHVPTREDEREHGGEQRDRPVGRSVDPVLCAVGLTDLAAVEVRQDVEQEFGFVRDRRADLLVVAVERTVPVVAVGHGTPRHHRRV
ncbi:hypothetical protein C489_12964 [Natrinema versiforme JCM 10478]|uniref:Uncharacterized protein n=1 Tax=Natrinema versiforme JCM 10478 TaxID=1227496 RepID=L9XYR4_9EURY|nr:hypothetical protein C489_12964 [Natrinema versiforme JCM 10478]